MSEPLPPPPPGQPPAGPFTTVVRWQGWQFLATPDPRPDEPPPQAWLKAVDAVRFAPGPILRRVQVEEARPADGPPTQRLEPVWQADATRLLHELACEGASELLARERAEGREPDPRWWAAVATKRRWARGEASDAELDAALAALRESEARLDALVRNVGTWDRAFEEALWLAGLLQQALQPKAPWQAAHAVTWGVDEAVVEAALSALAFEAEAPEGRA